MMGSEPTTTTEEYGFTIPDLVIAHSTAQAVVTVTIRYVYEPDVEEAQYVDFNQVAKTARGFLTAKRDPNTYWEVLNKTLTRTILDAYPVLVGVTSELSVKPNRADPLPNVSIVTCRRGPTAAR